jgi:hypothetical protein
MPKIYRERNGERVLCKNVRPKDSRRVPMGASPRLGNASHGTPHRTVSHLAPLPTPRVASQPTAPPPQENTTSASNPSMATRCYAAATVVVSSRPRAPRLGLSSYTPPSGSYRRAAVRAMGASPSSPSPSGQAPGAYRAVFA